MQIYKHKFICRLNINVPAYRHSFFTFHFSKKPSKIQYIHILPDDKNITCTTDWFSVELHIGNTVRLFAAAEGARGEGEVGGDSSRAMPEPHEAGPPRVASGAWQGFREVGRRAGWQLVPRAEAAGGSRHCEALPEWTEIFSSAHKGHFSLPQHNTGEPQ